MQLTIPLTAFFVWIMLFLRVGFLLAFFPVIGDRFIPLQIRIVLAAAISLSLTPILPLDPMLFPSTMGGVCFMVLAEAFLGMSVGFVIRVLFTIIQFSGQIMGEQMGFGLINAIDPTGSHQISVVAELQYVLSVLVFLTADLHHIFFTVIADSYQLIPPGAAVMTAGVHQFFLNLGVYMFKFAVQLAMPVIVIIFSINISLGMIGRGVPQINVFLESFPLRIIAGISVVMISLGFLVSVWEDLFGRMNGMLHQLMRAMI